MQVTVDNLQGICRRNAPGLIRVDRTTQRAVGTERGGLRVIDVIPQHVEGVVHAAAEVEVVEMLGEVLPPAHIQQVAGELVKALQLRSGGGRGREGKGEWLPAGLSSKLRKHLLTRPRPLQ